MMHGQKNIKFSNVKPGGMSSNHWALDH